MTDTSGPVLLAAAVGGARLWCSDRRGGVSASPYATCNVGDHVGDDPVAVEQNRARVGAAAGLGRPREWVWLHQVHGDAVFTATAPPRSKPTADAAITHVRGLPLAIVTADCAPVVLANDDTVAVAHAGHRGLAMGVIERTVTEMRARGTGPVAAYLGPCIHPAAYEFGVADLEPLVTRFGAEVAGTTADGKPALDIPAAVRIALERADVDAFVDCDVCTAASPDHFSHRRDGPTGRQVTVAVLL